MLKIVRGAVALTLVEGLGLLLALLTLPHLMRVLGTEGFGQFAFGVAACTLLSMITDHGFNQLGPKLVARAPESGPDRARLFWSVQVAKAQVSVVAVPSVWLLAWIFGLPATYGSVLMVIGLGALASLSFPQWFLQGSLRLRTLARAQSSARVLVAAAQLVFVQAPGDALLAVILQAGLGVGAGILALADGDFRKAIKWQRTSLKHGWPLLHEARRLFMSNLAVASYTTAVPLVVGSLTSPATLGLFSAGDRIRAAVQSLLAPIGTAAFPHFSRLMQQDRTRGLAAARRLLAFQVAMALLACGAIALGARPLIVGLVGSSFIDAVPVAQVLGLCIVCTAISNTLGMQVMLALDMERAFTAILIGCAAVGIGMTAIWSAGWLQLGAAFAVLTTEALVAGLMAWFLWRRGVWKTR